MSAPTEGIPPGFVGSFAFEGIVSYRKLHYWTRTGYLKASGGDGPGVRRLWPDSEPRVAIAMTRLCAVGLSLAEAASIARRGPCTAAVGAGIRLTVTAELWDLTDALPTTPAAARQRATDRELSSDGEETVRSPRFATSAHASDPVPPLRFTEWLVLAETSDEVYMKSSDEAEIRKNYDRWHEHGEPVRLAHRQVTRRVSIEATIPEVVQA